ncbi:MAG: NAD(P)H-hydrate dehydratase [Thermodesulfobacteriota bacterium]
MKLVTAEQMRNMDSCAVETYGIPSIVLMENAGRSAAEIIHGRYFRPTMQRALIFSGKGNNGGDGFVIGRHLQIRGWEVQVVVLAEAEKIQGIAADNLKVLQRSGIELSFAPDAECLNSLFPTLCQTGTLIVDAMFGNGLTSAIRGHYLDALRWINSSSGPVVAVDMPSGVDASSGAILGETVKADCSISFACAKVGQVSAPAYSVGGDLLVADIGMPHVLSTSVSDALLFVDADEARRLLPSRHGDSHKGTCGHSLIMAGTPGKGGAAQMAAHACVRAGSGLTTLVVPQQVQHSIAGHIPEVMTQAIPDSKSWNPALLPELERLWQERSVVAAGPGLGQEPECIEMVQKMVGQCSAPLVLDADALNAIAAAPEVLAQRSPEMTVITPHPGEMARLCGIDTRQVQEQRIHTAQEFAERHGVVVVLKGARSVIADPQGNVRINSSGNPGMASGGMGDILTGVIAAYIAQGLAPLDAATLGVYVHGRAADLCAHQFGPAGYSATNVADNLAGVWQELESVS